MALWTAFLLGLAGSLHCAGMCGPLLFALAKARPRTVQASTGRVCYHLGRVSSYCIIGLLFGLFGHLAAPAGYQRWLSITLGVVLLIGWLMTTNVSLATPLMRWILWLRSSMGGLMQRNSLLSQATMGALNGLLPCGLVYVAAAGATATGHPLTGATYMALFGLGTWPMMLGLHFAGERFPLPTWAALGLVTRVAVLLMAALLILRGLELGIPFVSPDLSATHAGNIRCH